ncbi:MAG TPA: hypothetical protein VMY42_18015 [Thermoguttaceae bacterium]|nr:hypothetical protein [Thermoguttaceae bacterium]
MGYLTAEEILARDDLQTEDVAVPEWGGTVRVRTMTAGERDRFEERMWSGGNGEADKGIMRAFYVGSCTIDEDGKRLFTDEQMTALTKKSASAMDRVFDVVRKLSGLTAADMEELEKN